VSAAVQSSGPPASARISDTWLQRQSDLAGSLKPAKRGPLVRHVEQVTVRSEARFTPSELAEVRRAMSVWNKTGAIDLVEGAEWTELPRPSPEGAPRRSPSLGPAQKWDRYRSDLWA
jgi:hypothetical protein